MLLNDKIIKAIELHPEVVALLQNGRNNSDWKLFTRTHFNTIARFINKKVTQEVIKKPELLEQYLVIGKLKLEKEIYSLRKKSVGDFINHLGSFSPYRTYNWISGKTLQSYWNGGDAKEIKANALLAFLQVPYNRWDEWMIWEIPAHTGINIFSETNKSSMAVVRKYYTGNYFLYYQKTDGSRNVIKTPFVLKEDRNGDVIMQSISEGHRYIGKVTGVRDGCLYMDCQNLDFEEMEQYVFNIGLETKPEVLFGVSTTVSVKDRLAVGLKNVLVKQKSNISGFEEIKETEIPFDRRYNERSEEAVIVHYLKGSGCNVITSRSCCDLDEMGFDN